MISSCFILTALSWLKMFACLLQSFPLHVPIYGYAHIRWECVFVRGAVCGCVGQQCQV